MKLAQISQNDAVHRAAIAALMKTSPLFNYLEFMKTNSEAVPYKPTDGSGTLQSRAKGSDYSAGTSQNQTQASAAVALMGMPVTIDKFDLMTHLDIPALKTARIMGAVKVAAKAIEAKLFNGTGSSNQIDGISTLVDSSYEEDLATNGLDLNTSGNEDVFLKTLDRVLADIDPTFIALNPTFLAWLQNVARDKHALSVSLNEFGVPVVTYNLIPLVGIRGAGIPQTETVGSATDCTTLYAVRTGELDGLTYHSPAGLDVTDFAKVGNSVIEEGNIELYAAPSVYQADAIYAIHGARFA